MNKFIQWLCPDIVNNMARSVSDSKRITTIAHDLNIISASVQKAFGKIDANTVEFEGRIEKLNNWTTDMQARLSNLSTTSNDRHNQTMNELRAMEGRIDSKYDRLDQLVIALIAGDKLGSTSDN